MNDATSGKLHNLSAARVVSGQLDADGYDEAVIDFGAAIGIWKRLNTTAWVRLHALSTQSGSGGLVSGNVDGM